MKLVKFVVINFIQKGEMKNKNGRVKGVIMEGFAKIKSKNVCNDVSTVEF